MVGRIVELVVVILAVVSVVVDAVVFDNQLKLAMLAIYCGLLLSRSCSSGCCCCCGCYGGSFVCRHQLQYNVRFPDYVNVY